MGITKISISLIRFYQIFLSPLIKQALGVSQSCRYSPTCSEYAIRMITKHGLLQGVKKAIIRLSTCHPFSKSYVGTI